MKPTQRPRSRTFNAAGKNAAAAGLQFFYHAHGFEFAPGTATRTLFDMVLAQTDPQTVKFELDIFWAHHGGADPVALLKAHPTRFVLTHMKDMKPGTKKDNTGHAPDDTSVALGQRRGQRQGRRVAARGDRRAVAHHRGGVARSGQERPGRARLPQVADRRAEEADGALACPALRARPSAGRVGQRALPSMHLPLHLHGAAARPHGAAASGRDSTCRTCQRSPRCSLIPIVMRYFPRAMTPGGVRAVAASQHRTVSAQHGTGLFAVVRDDDGSGAVHR